MRNETFADVPYKNESLHFCNKEHEMQWKCKFSS